MVQLLCRADSPRQAIQEVEAFGQQIAQLWQSQWASAQTARETSLWQMLDHLRSAWVAQELQQEIFYESLAH